MTGRSEQPRRPAARRAVAVPDRKISETILDFGGPLLSLAPESVTIESMRKAMQLVLTVWNAYVLAMPIWGEPHHLERFKETLRAHTMPPEMAALMEILSKRRLERFSVDPRAVGEWDVVPDGEGGYTLRCDARMPAGTEPERPKHPDRSPSEHS